MGDPTRQYSGFHNLHVAKIFGDFGSD